MEEIEWNVKVDRHEVEKYDIDKKLISTEKGASVFIKLPEKDLNSRFAVAICEDIAKRVYATKLSDLKKLNIWWYLYIKGEWYQMCFDDNEKLKKPMVQRIDTTKTFDEVTREL